MKLSAILDSHTFRFLSTYVAGVSIAVFLVMLTLYTKWSGDYLTTVRASVSSEAERLKSVYAEGGALAARSMLSAQSENFMLPQFVYVIASSEGQLIAGNLREWPELDISEGWGMFYLERPIWGGDTDQFPFVSFLEQLPGGEMVLVARHHSAAIISERQVSIVLYWTLLVSILLGGVGGVIMARRNLRQVENINRSAQRILEGDLSERIPDVSSQPDFQTLVGTVNLMLDEIQRLMDNQKTMSDNIAHDLRTPLTRIQNSLSLLQDEMPDEASQHKVESLRDEAAGLLKTFAVLLRISQLDSGGQLQDPRPVALDSLVLDVIELYEPIATDKSLLVEQSVEPGLSVRGDRDQLFQAIANLVDNAIKYTPEGGQVGIKLSRCSGQIVLEIYDSGSGIPPEYRKQVFQRFFRVEGSRSLYPGNGLGLSLVHSVFKLHGATIELLDNHPGLRVLIRIPGCEEG